jgi:site-specific recombinase XerD
MILEQAMRAFQEAQDAEGFTTKTQLSYSKVLVLLARYLRDKYRIAQTVQVTPEHLRQWLIDLRHEPGRYGPRSSRTVQTYCRHMRPFFRWLHDQGYLPTNPAASIKLPKAKKTLIRIFEDDEVTQLQQACEPPQGRKATFLQKGLAGATAPSSTSCSIRASARRSSVRCACATWTSSTRPSTSRARARRNAGSRSVPT